MLMSQGIAVTTKLRPQSPAPHRLVSFSTRLSAQVPQEHVITGIWGSLRDLQKIHEKSRSLLGVLSLINNKRI